MENYNSFCKEKKCPNLKEWTYYGANLVSCTLAGESENISEYPHQCLFIDEIEKLKI